MVGAEFDADRLAKQYILSKAGCRPTAAATEGGKAEVDGGERVGLRHAALQTRATLLHRCAALLEWKAWYGVGGRRRVEGGCESNRKLEVIFKKGPLNALTFSILPFDITTMSEFFV